VDRNENLYRVDLDNARATLVGVTGVFLEGLAVIFQHVVPKK